jgi:hypothetical protein
MPLPASRSAGKKPCSRTLRSVSNEDGQAPVTRKPCTTGRTMRGIPKTPHILNVRENLRRGSVAGHRGAEAGHDDRAGDPDVSGDPQRRPGVVIEPGQDLGAGPVRERVMGEIGLPALRGELGLKAQARTTLAAWPGRG